MSAARVRCARGHSRATGSDRGEMAWEATRVGALDGARRVRTYLRRRRNGVHEPLGAGGGIDGGSGVRVRTHREGSEGGGIGTVVSKSECMSRVVT